MSFFFPLEFLLKILNDVFECHYVSFCHHPQIETFALCYTPQFDQWIICVLFPLNSQMLHISRMLASNNRHTVNSHPIAL